MTDMEYHSKMQCLFSEWQEKKGETSYTKDTEVTTVKIDHTKDFICDGVVWPESWFSTSFRPLFLLKEAYGNGKWNLTKCLSQSWKAYPMWKRVSRWTYGLENTSESKIATYKDWKSSDAYIDCDGNEYITHIAVVNIKKSGGKSHSDMNDIRAYANFDRKFLRTELEYCDPTIIICGYTGSALEIILGKEFRSKREPNDFYYVTLNNHDVLVLDYWHPANHYPDILNYYGLMGIYQQALIEKTKK